MKSGLPYVLTINGGSSSIRFAVYEAGKTPVRYLEGKIDRIGLTDTNFTVKRRYGGASVPFRVAVNHHTTAVEYLLDKS